MIKWSMKDRNRDHWQHSSVWPYTAKRRNQDAKEILAAYIVDCMDCHYFIWVWKGNRFGYASQSLNFSVPRHPKIPGNFRNHGNFGIPGNLYSKSLANPRAGAHARPHPVCDAGFAVSA